MVHSESLFTFCTKFSQTNSKEVSMEEVNMQEGRQTMLLTDLPIECWEKILPAERSMMMSMASKAVKALMLRGRPCIEIRLSFNARLDIGREGDAKRMAILRQLGAMAENYRIVTLDLIHFGMKDQDFPQLAAVLERSVALKCLELAYNDIGLGVCSLPHIAGLTSLTTLNMARCNNVVFWTMSLANILRGFPLLSHLSLEGNRMGMVTFEVETPPLCPMLKFLCLRENNLKFHSLLCVKEVLRQCPGLEHLDMSCNEFRAAEMDVLVGMFEHCPRLSYLNFDANDMKHDEVDVGLCLARALSPLEKVTEVNLGFNVLGGLRHLAHVFEKWTGLEYLNLAYTSIGTGGARILAGLLEHFEQLKALNVGGSAIGWRGTQALAAGIGRCTRLTGLNMSNNNIGVIGATSLADVLGNCPVKFLYLSNCDIGARGCEALATVTFEHLDDLSLMDNDISVRGVQAIARAVGGWPVLKSLSLGGNYIGVRGMNAVTDVLEDSKGLTYLDIGRNNVQDKGVEALTLGLRRCPTLETLILSHNNITDAGARSLAGVLHECTALKRLSLSHNEEIGPDGENVLRKVPACLPVTIELFQRGGRKAGGWAVKWCASC